MITLIFSIHPKLLPALFPALTGICIRHMCFLSHFLQQKTRESCRDTWREVSKKLIEVPESHGPDNSHRSTSFGSSSSPRLGLLFLISCRILQLVKNTQATCGQNKKDEGRGRQFEVEAFYLPLCSPKLYLQKHFPANGAFNLLGTLAAVCFFAEVLP